MNDTYDCTVNPAGKKPRRSSAALALTVLVGLALLLPGAAALATSNPIPGVDIIVKKNPGGIAVSAPTGADGAYQFKGLAPGNYDLSVAGQRVQTITVDNKGSIGGVLSEEPDGTASISVNGPSGLANHTIRVIRITNVRANANQLGKANQPIITKDVDNLTTQAKTSSTDGVGELPGKTAKPLQGTPVGLEGDPGSVKVSTTTGADGTFHFDKLPPGKYKLTLPGLPSQSITVGADGIAGGKVMRGPDDSMSIFDRWGNRSTAKEQDDVITVKGKTAEKPGSFGSGIGHGAGTGMGPSGGMGGTDMNPGMIPIPGGPMGGPAGLSPGGPGSPMRP